jgi:hypothetical protein
MRELDESTGDRLSWFYNERSSIDKDSFSKTFGLRGLNM